MTLTVKKFNRKLKDYKYIKKLFKTSFPKREKYSFFWLVLLAKRRRTNFLVFYDKKTFCGLVYTTSIYKANFGLYLVVDESLRHKGYGKKILEYLNNRYKNGLMLDIEYPDPESDNYNNQLKREQFYIKNGYHFTGYVLREGKDKYKILTNTDIFNINNYKKCLKKISFKNQDIVKES